MQIKECKFKNACLIFCKIKQRRQSGMEWKFSIELYLLCKMDSVLFKILSLRNCLIPSMLDCGTWCWILRVVRWCDGARHCFSLVGSRTGAYKHNIMKTVKEPVAYKGIDGKNHVNRAENLTSFMQRGNHCGTSGYQTCLDDQSPFQQHSGDNTLHRCAQMCCGDNTLHTVLKKNIVKAVNNEDFF